MAQIGAVTLLVGACVLMLLAGNAFVAPRGGSSGLEQHHASALRGSSGIAGPAGEASLPVAGFAAFAAIAVAAAARASSLVTRHATAVKKKGVRVVEGKEIPWNLFAPKAPYKGTVVSNETITSKTPLVNWETTHVVMRHDKNVPYLEGQSIGIIAPGPDKKGETPAKVRLYSIASSACGDDETFETVSLCVKRVVEVEGRGWCEYSNVPAGTDKEFPDAKKVYRGVCSNHICDSKPGDEMLITGPTGAEMLLPDDPEANIIMLATGTGIAPFRSFLRYLFHDKATRPAVHPVVQKISGSFRGKAWLFLGVPYSQNILYDEEWKQMKEDYPDNFAYDYAISDEQTNQAGGKMWVQHRVMEYSAELWTMLKDPKTHVYMCGLKGMESGFQEAFAAEAEKEGIVWAEYVKGLKKAKRYHVEVY